MPEWLWTAISFFNVGLAIWIDRRTARKRAEWRQLVERDAVYLKRATLAYAHAAAYLREAKRLRGLPKSEERVN